MPQLVAVPVKNNSGDLVGMVTRTLSTPRYRGTSTQVRIQVHRYNSLV